MNWIRNRKAFVVLGAVLAFFLLSAESCDSNSKEAQPFNDAPTVGQPDYTGAKIYAMPDGFGNIAIKCKGHTAIWTMFHNASPYGAGGVVPNAMDVCP